MVRPCKPPIRCGQGLSGEWHILVRMKTSSQVLTPDAQLRDAEPTPLPPPPPLDFNDDHYGDDDDEPSWWSALRPLSTVHPALPPLPPPRRRARTASDEVCATAHVLRVRARLAPDEQRAFDELM